MRRSLFGLMAVLVAAMSTAPAAQAVKYEYWSYWHTIDGSWTFSGVGPATVVPEDGSVEGWRFAVSEVQGRVAPELDAATAFDIACADAAIPPPDAKRVALVIDNGSGATTSCVVINADATGYEVLTSSHELRTERGFVCAIDGVPERGCGDAVDDEPSSATASQTPRDTPSPSKQEPSATLSPTPTLTPATPEVTSRPTPVSASPVAATTETTTTFPWIPTAIVLAAIGAVAVVLVVRRR